MEKKIKKNLIIDAANEKIIFKIIDQHKIYTNDYENSRKNFDRFALLLFNFLKQNMISFNAIDIALVNLGPGKYSSIRTSLSTLKALNLIYKFKLYINNEYFGLYLSVEHIDDTFISKNFDNDNGNLWKCIWPADLTYRGQDAEDYHPYYNETRPYELKTNRNEYDYSKLARLIKVIHQSPDSLEICLLYTSPSPRD